MKGIILITSLFLSCVSGGTGDRKDISEDRPHGTVVSSTDRNTTEEKADLNDLAILPVRTASYSGNVNCSVPSFRSTNSARRVQPSSKSGFRIIKAGKVFDRNNFYTFLAVILQFQSGIHSIKRYIYSICNLLI